MADGNGDLWWTGDTAVALERSVIGSILIVGNAVLPAVERVMQPTDLMRETHRCIYEAILAVAEAKADPDLILVTHELAKQGRLERAGGAAFVAALVDAIPSVDSAVEYAKRVHECAVMRRVKGVVANGHRA